MDKLLVAQNLCYWPTLTDINVGIFNAWDLSQFKFFEGWEQVHHQLKVRSHALAPDCEVAINLANNQLGVAINEQPPCISLANQGLANNASDLATLFVALNSNLTAQLNL